MVSRLKQVEPFDFHNTKNFLVESWLVAVVPQSLNTLVKDTQPSIISYVRKGFKTSFHWCKSYNSGF